MEDREKPHVDKYKEITNKWNYDASCSHTPLLENFKCSIFVAQCAKHEIRKFHVLDFCCTVYKEEMKQSGTTVMLTNFVAPMYHSQLVCWL
jgi:hypothetical protein